jgi:hypothetical protein
MMFRPQKSIGLAPATAEAALPSTHAGPTPQERRWLRMSVRGLLCLIVVIACGLGWTARFIRAGQAQSARVKEINRAGGWVVYDFEWNNGPAGDALLPRWPRWLIDSVGHDYLGHVVFVNLHDRGSDGLLGVVGRLTHLKQLHRCGPRVTDAGLARLMDLRELQLLSLDDSQITDSGLNQLAKLTHLRWLRIARTKVTDAGVATLERSLPNLKVTR